MIEDEDIVRCGIRKKGQDHCVECDKKLNSYQKYDTCSVCRNDMDKFWKYAEGIIAIDKEKKKIKNKKATERMLRLRRGRGVKERIFKQR